MTSTQFDIAFRAFCRRQPFRRFWIEFFSGNQVLVRHPEVIRREGDLYLMRAPEGGSIVFAADSVARMIDMSIPQ